MDTKDIRTLQLLEELEKNDMPSQRHLAKQLNISLGLVNSFLKRLAQKGYFKITTIPKNRVKYILTPKGATEKTRLTYKYIKYSYLFYKDARNKLRELFKNLEDNGVQKIVFYGATDLAEIAYLSLQETSIVLVAIVDDHQNGRKIFNYKTKNPKELANLAYDKILITTTSSSEEIVQEIVNRGINKKVIALIE